MGQPVLKRPSCPHQTHSRITARLTKHHPEDPLLLHPEQKEGTVEEEQKEKIYTDQIVHLEGRVVLHKGTSIVPVALSDQNYLIFTENNHPLDYLMGFRQDLVREVPQGIGPVEEEGEGEGHTVGTRTDRRATTMIVLPTVEVAVAVTVVQGELMSQGPNRHYRMSQHPAMAGVEVEEGERLIDQCRRVRGEVGRSIKHSTFI